MLEHSGPKKIYHHPLWELTLARLRELFREPGIVFWVFGFPVLLTIGLGVAFRDGGPPPSKVGVVGDAPWALQALKRDRVEGVKMTQEEAWQALSKGRIDAVAILTKTPQQWSITYRFDGQKAEGRLARLRADSALQRRLGRREVAITQDRIITEKGARYVDFLVPGLLGMNIMSSSMWGMAYSLVLSRKRKLLKRMAATPMRRAHYLLSYLLSRVMLLGLEVLGIVFFGWLIFGVDVRGSLMALALVSLAGAASFAGIGLVVGARLENTEVASGWMNFIMLPMWILSGSFFSYERFPEVFHPFLRLLPLTALNDALRGLMNRGDSLLSLWSEMLVITLWGTIGFVVALRRFQWR